MRLIRAELWKIGGQKKAIILLLMLWAFGQYFFWNSADTKKVRENQSFWNEVTEYKEALLDKSPEESLEWLKEKKSEWKALYDYSDDKINEFRALSLLIDSYEYLTAYPAYVQKVISQADGMEKVAVFQESASAAIDNILKTKADFSEMLDVSVQLDKPDWVLLGTRNQTVPFLLVLQVLVCVAAFFSSKQGSGFSILEKAQYKGRLPAIRVKML